MIRIGIYASFLRKQDTGVGQVTVNFLRKLAENESRSSKKLKDRMEFILYMEKNEYLEFLEDPNIRPGVFQRKVFLPPYKRDDLIRKIWWEKFLLPKKAKEDECDVFLSLYQCPTILPKSIPHIMVVHDIIPKLFPSYLNNWRKKLYQRLTEKAIRNNDKIIAVSHRTEKDLIQHLGIDPKKIGVCHVSIDEIYRKEVFSERSEKVLRKYQIDPGYIYSGGGLEMRKNTESVLRAYKILSDEAGRFGKLPKLVISGRLMPKLAPLITDIEQLVEGLELRDRVILLDYVPQEDLPALYKSALMFVYPSLYEGFGLPVLEAMSQGTPVITSKTSSLPEVGCDAVLYCDPNKIEDLAMVMKNLMKNEHLRSALSAKAKERANHFSWNVFTEKVMNVTKALRKKPDISLKKVDELDY
jgi:glycosyltransferase involved in cell wall biosynthesis